jgi:HlyD family secretion protein
LRRPDGRLVLAGGAALALLALVPLARTGPDAAAADPIVVQRQDLPFTVEIDGELSAVRSSEIGVPPVSEVEFKIAFLAPEGAAVQAGQPIVGFDTEALEEQLADARAQLAEAEKKIEKTRLVLDVARLDVGQRVAAARGELGKAQLKVEVPPEVQQRVELEKARLDHRGRARELQNLQGEADAQRHAGAAELDGLRAQRDAARSRVAHLESAIARMTVTAPAPGILVYRTNWRDEKKKVGDNAWSGETILAVPDLSSMEAAGFVDEADGGGVAPGQPVTLRLEARPDLDLHGTVRRVARTVRQRSARVPVKVFRVDVALQATDPTVMRPAMRFRGEIETGRLGGRLVVPRDAVFLRASGPVVWRRGRLGWRQVAVHLGARNRRFVEVLGGVAEGDRLSPVDVEDVAATRGDE